MTAALVVVGTQYNQAEGLAPTLHGAIDRVRGRYTSGRQPAAGTPRARTRRA